MLVEGTKAPNFTLKGSDGRSHKLSDFRGRYVVLYFYPKDDTPGCTIEAKGFNRALGRLRELGAEVLGVSRDDLDSHGKFCKRYSLRFILLSDPEAKTIKRYNAWGDKGIFGMGILRKTYIIDENGRIARIFDRVRPLGHEREVISAIAGIRGHI